MSGAFLLPTNRGLAHGVAEGSVRDARTRRRSPRLQAHLGRGLRALHRRRGRRADLREGGAAPRRPYRQRQLDPLRRRRLGDPLLADAADERQRHPRRLAGDRGTARLLLHHQEDAQRPAGRRDQSQRHQARGLRGGRLRERRSHASRPRPRHRPRPAAAAADPPLPQEGAVDLALPRRSVAARSRPVVLPRPVHRQLRRGRHVAARIRAAHHPAAALHHAGDQPLLDDQQGSLRRRDRRRGSTATASRPTCRSSCRSRASTAGRTRRA